MEDANRYGKSTMKGQECRSALQVYESSYHIFSFLCLPSRDDEVIEIYT